MQPLRVDIDPARIQRYFLVRTPGAQLRMNMGRILLPRPLCRGRWDQRTQPVVDHPVYRLMAGLLQHGDDPEYCRDLLAAYYRERGRPLAEAEAKADHKVDDVMNRYGGMLEDMAEHGYRPGLAGGEVGIGIARDGTLLKTAGGWHRFAAAHLLEIPEVRTEVRFIHPGWLKVRGFWSVPTRDQLCQMLCQLAEGTDR